MTSLPIVIPEPAVAPVFFDADEKILLQAFRSFAATAESLERSYAGLRSEVARLQAELARSNKGLARSLEENRAMRLHLDRVLDGLPCGVLVVKPGGMISRINPEGQKLLRRVAGKPPEAAPLQNLLSLPEDFRELLEAARCGGREQEQSFREEAGGQIWLAARYAALEAGDIKDDIKTGDPELDNAETDNSREWIFILRDVSDARKLAGERERNRREQALAEMSAVLAHEIRNPLGSLELFAGLLASAELAPEPRLWVEHVQAGLRTLGATVNNVLHFHSLPAAERMMTDLGALLDWAEGFLAPIAREAGAELRVHNRLQGVSFAADRHRLEQVLLNLVLNALRAMPRGGTVEISGATRMAESSAEESLAVADIAVSDTGPGLASGQGEKIFEPGFSTRPGSPGLGLAVCRKIVEQHEGTLAAANRNEGGARFTVRFRIAGDRNAGELGQISTEVAR
jgi:signal transduction histidine kinase